MRSITGCIIGAIMEEKTQMFKPFGQIFLNLIFTAVVPLVFFSLSSWLRR
ncbi:cation:dicarboxylate symporter family transporter [Fusibacter sp. 3D3]